VPKKHNATGRSTTKGRFAGIPLEVGTSEAWRRASPVARALLVEVAFLYFGSNNGRLGLSARQGAERLGCSKDTAARCFRELQDRGILEASRIGKFEAKSTPLASEWRLTWKKCDRSGKLPSFAYRHWEPPLAVRSQGQHGTISGTARSRKAADGTISGTETPNSELSRSDNRDTLRSYHGECAGGGAGPRSAPSNSAVASGPDNDGLPNTLGNWGAIVMARTQKTVAN
jgi:hypothetical protein